MLFVKYFKLRNYDFRFIQSIMQPLVTTIYARENFTARCRHHSTTMHLCFMEEKLYRHFTSLFQQYATELFLHYFHCRNLRWALI